MFVLVPFAMAQQLEHHCATDSSYFVPKALDCTPNSDAWINTYRLQESYVPNSINPWVGEKIIPINIIFFGEDNGTGYPLSPTAFDSLKPLIQHWMNEVYSNPSPPDSVIPICNKYLYNSKIKVVINNVRHYPNSSILNNHNSNQIINAVNYHLSFNPLDSNQINWYFVKKSRHSNAAGEAAIVNYNGSKISVIFTASDFFNYSQPWESGYLRFVNHFPHELGHHLELEHLYSNLGSSSEYFLYPHTHYNYLCDVWNDSSTNNYPGGFTNNIMGGSHPKLNNWYSPLQMGRSHRTLILNEMRHYAYGYNPVPIEISTDQTWDFTFKSYNDIVIKTGATLTITCRLEMVKEASIFVEPGARLIIDGGTITSARSAGPEHEGLWQGIQLYGNSSMPQTLQSNGYYPQAHLIMKNDAIIENAYNAVTTWKFNDYSKTGGLIHASNSTFRNNKRSVEFMAYDFVDKSYFNECRFIMDDTLIDGSIPNPMVTMWNIKGPRFTGSIFQCDDSLDIDPYNRPKGIYSIGAGFTVNAKCTQTPPPVGNCPNNYSIPSSFSGLSIGIHATNSISNTFKVQKSKFENCQYGIIASRVNNYAVLQSTFNVNKYYSTSLGVGLANEYCTGFQIQENQFNGSSNTDFTIGLLNSETGIASNIIYKNSFNNLRYANWVNGNNWSYSSQHQGLVFECNSHSDNSRDISVAIGTVGQNQGSIFQITPGVYGANPAKNTFSNLIDPVGHFANFGSNHVYYLYANDTSSLIYEPINRTINNVSSYNVNGPLTNLSCPSHLINGDIPAPTPPISNNFYQKRLLFLETAYTYQTYIDGGNTQLLLTQIDQTWPNQAWDLRNELLAKSPYLSIDALYGLADKADVMPHALMLDVFMANPHCGRDSKFTDYLLNKEIPMPIYMVNILKGDTTRTLKDDMESAMAYYMGICSQIANTIMHYYLTDTLNSSLDSALAWSQRKGDLASIIYDADLKSNLLQYNNALNKISDIYSNTPRLSSDILSSLNSREESWTLLKNFQYNGNEFWNLDSAQQSLLFNYAIENTEIGNLEAKNILEFFYGHRFNRILDLNEFNEPKNKKWNNTHKKSNYNFKVYPNPAESYITFEFNSINFDNNKLTIQIMDINGKSLLIENLNNTIKSVDIQNLSPGTYFYKISNNEQNLLHSDSFIKK